MARDKGGLTLQEAADLAGCGKSTAYDAEKRGKIVRAGKLLSRDSVERWILQRSRGDGFVRIRPDAARDARVMAQIGPEGLPDALQASGRVSFLTKGQIGTIDVLRACVDLAGPGCTVQISVWRIGADAIGVLRELLTDGRIARLRVIIDHAFASLTGGRKKHIQAAIEVLGHVVHETKCHLKVTTVRGANGDFAIRSSANLNRIQRWEQFDVDDDAALCDFYDRFFDSVCDTIEPGFAKPHSAVMEGFKVNAHGHAPLELYRAREAREVASEFDDAIERGDTIGALAVVHAQTGLDNVDATIAAAGELDGDDGGDVGRGETLTQIRKRHERAKADRAEMARDEMAGSLVRVDELRDAWHSAGKALREKLQAVPDRVAAEVAAVAGMDSTGEIAAIISGAVRDALQDLQDSQMPHDARPAA